MYSSTVLEFVTLTKTIFNWHVVCFFPKVWPQQCFLLNTFLPLLLSLYCIFRSNAKKKCKKCKLSRNFLCTFFASTCFESRHAELWKVNSRKVYKCFIWYDFSSLYDPTGLAVMTKYLQRWEIWWNISFLVLECYTV